MKYRFSDYPKHEIKHVKKKESFINYSRFCGSEAFSYGKIWLAKSTETYSNNTLLVLSHTYSLGLNLFCFDKILAVTCVFQLRLYYSFGLLSAVSASAAHWPRFRCVRVQEQAREMQLKISIRNAQCYLGVSGSLWLLFVIGSKFKTALVFLPCSLDLNSLISLVTSPFRTMCSDTDGNVWIVQYSNPSVKILWTKCYFAVLCFPCFTFSLLKTAAVINGFFAAFF